jgi:DNA-binding transcriptional MerR regulator
MTVSIPSKSNFRFQELTPITGVKPYVIRYWETEFPEIAPINSEKGEKIYARKDVEAILRVKELLFDEKLTIPQAKLKMSSPHAETKPLDVVPAQPLLPTIPSSEMTEGIIEALDLIREIKSKRNW